MTEITANKKVRMAIESVNADLLHWGLKKAVQETMEGSFPEGYNGELYVTCDITISNVRPEEANPITSP